MALLDKLKSLLGLGGSSAGRERRDTEVTVERDRTATDADTEEAVKGVDTSASDPVDVSAPDSDAGTEATETAPGSAAIEPDDAGSVDDAATEGDAGVAAETEDVRDRASDETDGETEPSDGRESDGGETEAATDDDAASELDPAEQSPAAEGGHAGSTASMGEEEADAESDGSVAEETTDVDESGGESGGASVDTVKGIGPAYAERLENADVYTVDELAAADPAEVAEATTVSEKRVERWIDRARERTDE